MTFTDTSAPIRVAQLLDGLSIVLPCLDEEANLAAAVQAATDAADRVARRHEIVVVDDGSHDATAVIATALSRLDARVRLVEHSRNRGYGAALRSGIAAARMPWIFLTDADLQFDLGELQRFVPLAADHDLLVGQRIERQDPFARRANAAAWNWLVRRVFDLDVRDVDCAFKLVRRDVVAALDLTSEGAAISPELLVKARERGARIRQLDVHHRPRVAGSQSGAKPRVVAHALRELSALHRTARPRAG